MESRRETRANLFIARIIPPIIVGVIAYACYAITKQVCINYLIHPSRHYHRSPRVGSGTAIIVIFYVLLIFVITTYLRLWQKVNLDPGYTPRGSQWAQNREAAERPDQCHSRGHGQSDRKPKHRRMECAKTRTRTTEKNNHNQPVADAETGLDYNAAGKAFPLDVSGLESFYTKDFFVCQEDGRPPYCSKCCQFKTDRAHHCREVDRCVRKMDHFCPWVGGVVSETSFKFFIQFVFYTTMFCIFALVVFSVFTAELRREAHRVNGHWIAGIVLSCFFGVFSFGMTVSSLQLAMFNVTTIENLNRRTKVWTLAIRIPDPTTLQPNTEEEWVAPYPTITYPLPDMAPPSDYQGEGSTGEARHVFAILHTQPGENPFDLDSSMKNLQQVLGFSLADWLLPLKQSPCADHSSLESAFALGPVVTRLKKDIGLEPLNESPGPSRTRRRGRKKNRQSERAGNSSAEDRQLQSI